MKLASTMLGVSAMLLVAATAGPAAAKDYPYSAILNLVNTSNTATKQADGSTLLRFVQSTVEMDNEPVTPMNLNPMLCYGFVVLASDGNSAPGAGACDGFDKDGDRWAVWWTTSDEDRWGVLYGTGKFEGMTGGGTTETLYVDDDHQVLKSTGVLHTKDR